MGGKASINAIKRYEHTLRVMDAAAELARLWKADQPLTALTAALHDCAKNITQYIMPAYGRFIGDFMLYPEVSHAPLERFTLMMFWG